MLIKQVTIAYKGEHEAPDHESGAPLYDLTQNGIFPADVYTNGGQYANDSFDNECLSVAKDCKGKPRKPVKVYRAVPKVLSKAEQVAELEKQKSNIMKHGKVPANVVTTLNSSKYYEQISEELTKLQASPTETTEKMTINNGDWVSLSLAYAKDHGRNNLRNQFRILTKTVKASELYCDGNLSEWGYEH